MSNFVRNYGKIGGLVLTVLSVISLVLLGLFFSTTSEQALADNPTSNEIQISDSNSIAGIIDRQEIISARDQNTRVWEITKLVDTEDPDTGEIIQEEVTSYIREKGCGICYKDQNEQWQSTDTTWRETEDGFVMDRAGYALDMGLGVADTLYYLIDDQQLDIRASRLEADNGLSSQIIATVNPNATGSIDPSRPNVLLFTDAFGSGIHLELEANPDGFHQNVIFDQKPTLPAGFDVEQTKLKLYTQMDFDRYVQDANSLSNFDIKVNLLQKEQLSLSNSLESISSFDPNSFGSSVTSDMTSISPLKKTTIDLENLGTEFTEPINQDIEFEINNGEESFVSFRLAESKILKAVDTHSAEKYKQIAAAKKQIIRDSFDNKTYLVESLDASVVMDSEESVIWDYHTISGTITSDEIWSSDFTYYLASDVTVNGATLKIEPGSIIKLGNNVELNATSGQLQAVGKPYEYIYLTSVHNDQIGEIISGVSTGNPASGDWDSIQVNSNSEIQFCKMSYGTFGVGMGDILANNVLIAHNVISDMESFGIYILIEEYETGYYDINVFNNLFTDISYSSIGITNYSEEADLDIIVSNNTIDTNEAITTNYGITIDNTGGIQSDIIIKNNIIAHASDGIGSNVMGNNFIEHNNCFYDCDRPKSLGTKDSTDIELDINNSPFDDGSYTDIGSYFLNKVSTGGYLLKNAGDDQISAYYGDTNQWAIHHVPNDGDHLFDAYTYLGQDTIWQPNYNTCDSGIVAIGYHHPRVDYVIKENAIVTVGFNYSMEILPGTVIACCSNSDVGYGGISVSSMSKFKCNGEPYGLGNVKFVEIATASQYVKNNRSRDTGNTIEAYGECEISFTEFREFDHAIIFYYNMGQSNIHDCIFKNNTFGLYASNCYSSIKVDNCLFFANRPAAIWSHKTDSIFVNNCTFHNNSIAVSSSTSPSDVAIQNSLFTQNGTALYGTVSTTFTESYNLFYNNNQHTSDYSLNTLNWTGLPYISGTNQVLSGDPYISNWDNFENRFYLNQGCECINNGSISDPMHGYTTDINQAVIDYNTRDIGYHYPVNLDTDGEGLLDYEEYWTGSDPFASHSDNDGLTDYQEVKVYGTDPTDEDSDGDGMWDDWEVQYGLNPLADDADGDKDLDTLTNYEEYQRGTNPDDLSDYVVTWYVKKDAGLGGDGLSWETAFAFLQDAIGNSLVIQGDEIWVAKGTYYPDEDEGQRQTDNDRTSTFQLIEGVSVYGGFDPDGGADEWSERDPWGNVTTLSGDIDDNNGTNDSGNSYRVVEGASNSLIDGFTVTGGYSLDLSNYTAAGLYTDGYMDITNCRFSQNYTNSLAGGILADNTSITISNCLIHHNQGTYGSGVLINFDSPNSTSPVNVTNCTISNNYEVNTTGPYSLGALYIYNSNNTNVTNCILWYNILYDAVGEEYYIDTDIVADESSPIMSYTDYGYQYNISPSNITNCISSDPLFANAAGGDFHLMSTTGRWDGTTPWTTDTETSPCINCGDPSIICDEPTPNGDRVNMGAYGNTDQASMSDLYPFIMTMDTSDSAALPTDAKWNITGGSVNMTDLSSGDVAMVPAGSYTISFECNNSTPYIPPDDENKTVSSSTVNYYTATYQACGWITVLGHCPAGLGFGGSDYGRWRIVGETTWRFWSVVKMPAGSQTIEFESLTDLEKPGNKTYTITKGQAYTKHDYYRLLNVYVDRFFGSDSNNGTVFQPFETMQHALVKIGSGGNIWLENAEYYESLSFPTDRTIYLRNNSGFQWADVHNTYYLDVPGNIARIGVRFEGQF